MVRSCRPGVVRVAAVVALAAVVVACSGGGDSEESEGEDVSEVTVPLSPSGGFVGPRVIAGDIGEVVLQLEPGLVLDAPLGFEVAARVTDGVEVSEEDALAVAEVFGLEGDLEDTGGGWTLVSDVATLQVASGALGEWYLYAEDPAAPQLCVSSDGVVPCASVSGDVDPVAAGFAVLADASAGVAGTPSMPEFAEGVVRVSGNVMLGDVPAGMTPTLEMLTSGAVVRASGFVNVPDQERMLRPLDGPALLEVVNGALGGPDARVVSVLSMQRSATVLPDAAGSVWLVPTLVFDLADGERVEVVAVE